MKTTAPAITTATATWKATPGVALQRQRACGSRESDGEECEACETGRVQTKLAVSAPGDPFEREADRVADETRGWRLPVPEARRDPSAGGVESWLQETVRPVLMDGGRELPADTRSRMESAFGYDFGRVRVHADAKAADSARALHANAYAVGEHLVFRPDRYRPETSEGERLIAHELAHTIQAFPPAGGAPIGRGSSPAEHAADRAAGVLNAAPGQAGEIARSAPAGGAVQCDGERTREELDDFTATTIRVFSIGVERTRPELLIPYAVNQASAYREARAEGQIHTRLALASLLVRIHRSLEAQEQSAERAANGTLLSYDFGQWRPWA